MAHNFQYWYSYYDFKIATISNAQDYHFIINQYIQNYDRLPISTLKGQSWPCYPGLEPMSKIFQNLQRFLISNESWCSDCCSTSELKIISKQLNQFYLILLIQKSYCSKLWKKDKRRVQASVCHYYFLLQKLIRAIVPQNLGSISQCKSKERLCLVLHQFQKTINKSLKYFEQIYQFMCSSQFYEEISLTNDFFQQLGHYLQNIVCQQVSNKPKMPKLYQHILMVTINEIAYKNLNQNKNQFQNLQNDAFQREVYQSIRDRSSTFQQNREEMPKKRLNKSLENIKTILSVQKDLQLPKVFDFSKKIKRTMLFKDPILIIDIENTPKNIQNNSLVSLPSTQCGSSVLMKKSQKPMRRQSFVIQLHSTTQKKKRQELNQAYKLLDRLDGVQGTIYLQRKHWKDQCSLSQKQEADTQYLKKNYKEKSKSINLRTGNANKNEENQMLLIINKLQKILKDQ